MKLEIPQSLEQFVRAGCNPAFRRIENPGDACEGQSKGMLLGQRVLLKISVDSFLPEQRWCYGRYRTGTYLPMAWI